MNRKCYLTAKRSPHNHTIMTVLAAHENKADAEAFCESANLWYGEGHPLTPLAVMHGDTLLEPKPFPHQALAALQANEART